MLYENIEIEQLLIGRALIGGSENIQLNEDDFIIPEHWLFLKAIQAGNKLTDFAKNLSSKDYEYLRSLVDAASGMPLTGFEDYEGTLKELSRKRKIHQAIEIGKSLLEDKSSSDVLTFINKMIQENSTSNLKTNTQVRSEIIDMMTRPPEYHTTGLRGLDRAMGGGLYNGYTYGICGKEKAGKTTLAHTISNQLECKHIYVAMEMGSVQIEQRNIAKRVNKNSLAFLQNQDEMKRLIETVPVNDNIFYHDAIGETLEQILHVVSMGILKHKIKGFIVDYWQLIQPSDNRGTEEKHLRDVAQGLANFARKHKVWCIVVAQMNKDGQLFGGNGLRKACDQLYMLEECETTTHGRWIRQDATRYTIKSDIGDEECPALMMDISRGPYFRDVT